MEVSLYAEILEIDSILEAECKNLKTCFYFSTKEPLYTAGEYRLRGFDVQRCGTFIVDNTVSDSLSASGVDTYSLLSRQIFHEQSDKVSYKCQ